ncbi:MAG: hypothetical protein FWH04_10285 [Oscillospiraceae bacterium]|nr:hypothetical protein [Oscillospiraceae bacterium]
MKKLDSVLSSLSTQYEARKIDGEEVIYRDLGNGFDFEVSGLFGSSKTCTLYVWTTCPQVYIVGTYIIPVEHLKDTLGHFAYKYQNLVAEIHVEREELIE